MYRNFRVRITHLENFILLWFFDEIVNFAMLFYIIANVWYKNSSGFYALTFRLITDLYFIIYLLFKHLNRYYFYTLLYAVIIIKIVLTYYSIHLFPMM